MAEAGGRELHRLRLRSIGQGAAQRVHVGWRADTSTAGSSYLLLPVMSSLVSCNTSDEQYPTTDAESGLAVSIPTAWGVPGTARRANRCRHQHPLPLRAGQRASSLAGYQSSYSEGERCRGANAEGHGADVVAT